MLVWTTETPVQVQSVRGPRYCEHGKDAGQTCYPCDVGTDSYQAHSAAELPQQQGDAPCCTS